MPSGFPDGIFFTIMKILPSIIFCCLLCFQSLYARNVNIALDILQYQGIDSLTECRLVYSLPDTSLRYIPSLEGYVGSLYMKVICVNTITKDSLFEEWIVDNVSQHPVVMHERNLIGAKSVYLKPGNYSIGIIAIDMHDSTALSSVRLPLPIRR